MGHRSHRIYGPPYPWATVLWATLSTRKKNWGREKNWQNSRTAYDFLLEAKNMRISYLYETHEVKFITLRSLCIWLHSQKISLREF